MVAANGDTIAFSYSGTFEPTGPTTVTFQTTGVITGGTGRYAGATGGATFTGSADLATLKLTGRFEANITQH